MRLSPLTRTLPGLLVLISVILWVPGPTSARVLELVEQATDTSLHNLRELAISPDGRFVYVGSTGGSARFQRNTTSGRLTFIEAGYGARSMAISPDGGTFYSSRGLGTVRAHVRDVENGHPTLVEQWQGSLAFGTQGGATGVHLSPDGAHLYVTLPDGIAVFVRDPESSVLTWVETIYDGVGEIEGLGPTDLAFSADGRHVYVTTTVLWGADGIAVFSRDVSTGALTWKQRLNEETLPELEDADEIRVSHDGRNVYLVGSDGVVALRRNPDDGTLSFLGAAGSSGTRTLIVGPDDRFVYVFLGENIEIYSRAVDTGALDWVETFQLPMYRLSGVESAEFSPDARHLYLASDYSNPYLGGVEVLSRDPISGRLAFLESYRDDVAGDADRITVPNATVVSPDGRHLYVGAEDIELEVAAFSRSSDTGTLGYLGSYSAWNDEAGFRTAQSLAMSPEGQSLYVFSRRGADNALALLARDEATGELTWVESHSSDGTIGLGSTGVVIVSPDGRHVYAAGSADGALVIFERDGESGKLSHLRTLTGIPALEHADKIGMDADGNNVYVASRFDRNDLAAFERDIATGDLAFIETHDLRGFGSPSSIEISPDGHNLYIGSESLSVFARHPTSGRLTFLEQVGPSSGAPHVSPDGKYVFTFAEHASVYRRDGSTGRLTLIESQEVLERNGSWTSALSPAGDFAYVGASFSQHHSIYVYRIEEGLCRATWDGLCLGEDRFRVELDWRDSEGNTGTASPVINESEDSGILWFFDRDNWEMQLKVLDACDLNDRFWVFAAATTDVEYTLRITDVVTGTTKTYFNPMGNAAGAITDTDAFATCSRSSATPMSASRSTLVDLSAVDLSGGSPVVRRAYQKAASSPLKKSHERGLVTGLGDKCLDVEGGDPIDGSSVILYDCHGGNNQRWMKRLYCDYHCTETFELEVFGDKCLQPGPDTGSGFRQLEIGPCSSGENLWSEEGHFPQEFSLVHVETGLCADVLRSGTDNRTPIVLYDCHGGDNQHWTFDELTCRPSPTGTCKNDDRFLLELEWRDFEGNVGKGRVVPQDSDESGLFWFFGPDNWEMLVKVLDGCELNQQYWVFAAATTDVEYTLRVTDTATREVREYFNSMGNVAPAITDSSAFSCSAQ